MLFMVIAKHSAEMCPGGIVRPDKELMNKTEKAMKDSGVNLVEGYLNGPGHIFYFIIETNDSTALTNAVEPLRLIGEVEITPVMKYSDARAWAKNIGIQK